MMAATVLFVMYKDTQLLPTHIALVQLTHSQSQKWYFLLFFSLVLCSPGGGGGIFAVLF